MPARLHRNADAVGHACRAARVRLLAREGRIYESIFEIFPDCTENVRHGRRYWLGKFTKLWLVLRGGLGAPEQ